MGILDKLSSGGRHLGIVGRYKKILLVALAGAALMCGANVLETVSGTQGNLPHDGTSMLPTAPPSSSPGKNGSDGLVTYDTYEAYLTQKIETFLSNLDGVGKVKAIVYVKESSQSIPASDKETNQSSTNEKDGEGGEREVENNSEKNTIHVIVDENGKEKVVILQETYPDIQGIAICAQGASSNVVKEQIKNALMALFGLPAHKIEVLSMGTGTK